MKTDDAMLLDHQLCFALYRASRAVIRAYAPLLDPLGLTYPQYLTMLVLWEEDGISMKTLGQQLALDSATLTPLLKRLEQDGIVLRARDTDDERVVRLHLTKKGGALRKKASGIPIAMACRMGNGADAATLRRLSALREELAALTQTLDETA